MLPLDAMALRAYTSCCSGEGQFPVWRRTAVRRATFSFLRGGCKYSPPPLLGFFLVLLCGMAPAGLAAQAQQPVLVIEGGTLIDGNGGPPVANAVVVIQGNRI